MRWLLLKLITDWRLPCLDPCLVVPCIALTMTFPRHAFFILSRSVSRVVSLSGLAGQLACLLT